MNRVGKGKRWKFGEKEGEEDGFGGSDGLERVKNRFGNESVVTFLREKFC